MVMFGWDFEVDARLRFWSWNLIKICVWTCLYFDKLNSTLGSVEPLAMFTHIRWNHTRQVILHKIWEYRSSLIFVVVRTHTGQSSILLEKCWSCLSCISDLTEGFEEVNFGETTFSFDFHRKIQISAYSSL